MNRRTLLGRNFLHSVEGELSLLAIESRRLRTHVLIDLSFPLSLRNLLRRIPLMKIGRAEPHIHLRIRVKVDIRESQQYCIVIKGSGHPLDDRREVEWNKVHSNTNLLQILLNQTAHAFARLVSGVSNEREAHGMAGFVLEHIAIFSEPVLLQQFECSVWIVWGWLQILIEPEPIRRTDYSNGRGSMPAKGYSCQIGAIDGHRHGAPEVARAKPVFLVLGERRLADFIEPELFGFDRGPEIARCGCVFAMQLLVEIRRHAVDQLNVALPESYQFSVAIREHIKPDRLQIGKLVS